MQLTPRERHPSSDASPARAKNARPDDGAPVDVPASDVESEIVGGPAERESLRFPSRDLAFEIDRPKPAWLRALPFVVAALFIAGGAWYFMGRPAPAPEVAKVDTKIQVFDGLRERIRAFPINADDVAIAEFLSSFVADASSLPAEQRELLKQMWNARRDAIDAARKKALTDAAASLRVPVRIRTRTPGAEISLNGGEAVPSPASFESVRAGAHTYEVRALGYSTVKSSFLVDKAEPISIDVTLDRLMGQLRIEATPEDSAWSVVSLEKEPFSQHGIGFGSLALPTGMYRVTFTREGHDSVVQDISVTEAGMAKSVVVFPEGRLSIQSGSQAYPLFVNGVRRGVTPMTLTLRAGTHEVEVDMGGQRVKQTILLSSRESARLEFKPTSLSQPAPTSIAVTAPVQQPAPVAVAATRTVSTPVAPEKQATVSLQPAPKIAPVTAEKVVPVVAEKPIPATAELAQKPAAEPTKQTDSTVSLPQVDEKKIEVAQAAINPRKDAPKPAAKAQEKPVKATPAVPTVATIFSLSEVTRRPVPVRQIAPDIPRGFEFDGKPGSVSVEIVIDQKGNVSEARVVRSSHRELEEPTLNAAKQWRFKPAQKDGAAVSVRTAIPFQFKPE